MKKNYSNVDEYAKDLWNFLGIKQISDDIGASSLNDLTNSLKNKMNDPKYMKNGNKDWNAMYNDLTTERKQRIIQINHGTGTAVKSLVKVVKLVKVVRQKN